MARQCWVAHNGQLSWGQRSDDRLPTPNRCPKPLVAHATSATCWDLGCLLLPPALPSNRTGDEWLPHTWFDFHVAIPPVKSSEPPSANVNPWAPPWTSTRDSNAVFEQNGLISVCVLIQYLGAPQNPPLLSPPFPSPKIFQPQSNWPKLKWPIKIELPNSSTPKLWVDSLDAQVGGCVSQFYEPNEEVEFEENLLRTIHPPHQMFVSSSPLDNCQETNNVSNDR